jgi:hypothetical protein
MVTPLIPSAVTLSPVKATGSAPKTSRPEALCQDAFVILLGLGIQCTSLAAVVEIAEVDAEGRRVGFCCETCG